MIDGIPIMEITGPIALTLVALMVITDRLVWHTRLKKVEEQRDRWERLSLDLLQAAQGLTVQAEVTNQILSRLPDPGRDEGQ